MASDIIACMCIICDGGTHDDVLFAIDSKVTKYGWMAQAIEAGSGGPGWVYTIGLADRFDHPELVVVCCDELAGHGLLSHLALRVKEGERFDDILTVETEPGIYDIVEVHQAQLDAGLVANWHNYYGALGRFDLRQQVLQVKAPPLMCARHTLHKWSLDRPAPLLNRSSATVRPTRPARAKRKHRP